MRSWSEPARSPATHRIGERGHHGPGGFCWAGLASSDPADAKAFSASVFGWQSGDLPAAGFGTYTALRHDGREVAIVYRQTREARAAHSCPPGAGPRGR